MRKSLEGSVSLFNIMKSESGASGVSACCVGILCRVSRYLKELQNVQLAASIPT